jgi:hypothetical protein
MTADWAFPPPSGPGPRRPGRPREPRRGAGYRPSGRCPPPPAAQPGAESAVPAPAEPWPAAHPHAPFRCRRWYCRAASISIRTNEKTRLPVDFGDGNGPKGRSKGRSESGDDSRPPDHADKFGMAGGRRCRRCRDDRIRNRRSGMTVGPPLAHPLAPAPFPPLRRCSAADEANDENPDHAWRRTGCRITA